MIRSILSVRVLRQKPIVTTFNGNGIYRCFTSVLPCPSIHNYPRTRCYGPQGPDRVMQVTLVSPSPKLSTSDFSISPISLPCSHTSRPCYRLLKGPLAGAFHIDSPTSRVKWSLLFFPKDWFHAKINIPILMHQLLRCSFLSSEPCPSVCLCLWSSDSKRKDVRTESETISTVRESNFHCHWSVISSPFRNSEVLPKSSVGLTRTSCQKG